MLSSTAILPLDLHEPRDLKLKTAAEKRLFHGKSLLPYLRK